LIDVHSARTSPDDSIQSPAAPSSEATIGA